MRTKSGGGEPEVVAHPSIRQDGSLPAKPPVAVKPSILTQAKEPTVQRRPQQSAAVALARSAGQRDIVTESISRPTTISKPRANSIPTVRPPTDLSSSVRKSIPPPSPQGEADRGAKRASAAGANRSRFPSSGETQKSPSSTTSSDLLQETDILSRLREQAKRNNCYGILHVGPSATQTELAQARRELTAQLHPDHFTGDPEQQRWAQDQLILVNQAFTDVLHNETNRQLYDQLCKFREVREKW